MAIYAQHLVENVIFLLSSDRLLEVFAQAVIITPGIEMGSGYFDLTGTIRVIKPQSPALVQEAKSLISAATEIPVVKECLRFFRAGLPSVCDMYKICEIIKFDCGNGDANKGTAEIIARGYIDKKVLKNLTSNFNHQDLQGENARHARAVGKPRPESYMEISDMQKHIIELFKKWVNDRIS